MPPHPLDRLIKKAAARAAADTAIAARAAPVTYGELVDSVDALAAAIAAAVPESATVAVAEPEVSEALVLMLGALAAGKRVLLVDARAERPSVEAQLAAAETEIVLTTARPGPAAEIHGVRVIARRDLRDSGGATLKPLRATDPAILLPTEAGVAAHSQLSAGAMAVSLGTFVPQLKDLTLAAPPPLWRWESLMAVIVALTNGRPIATGRLEELPAPEAGWGNAWTLLDREEVDYLLATRVAAEALSGLRYVWVSTGPFAPWWRRALEDLRGRGVLTLWGSTEAGPAVASHPTWFPLEGHGMCLVNARLFPLDPGQGTVSVVPWEMLDRAEVGIETLSGMVDLLAREGAPAWRVGKLVRTGAIASIDHVGTVTIHRLGKAG